MGMSVGRPIYQMNRYIGFSNTTPISAHTPPTRNSPSINPRKNGARLRNVFKPPKRRIHHLIIQLMNTENQKKLTAHVPEMPYPTGYRGHQTKRVRIAVSRKAKTAPKHIARIDKTSTGAGLVSQLWVRRKMDPYHTSHAPDL